MSPWLAFVGGIATAWSVGSWRLKRQAHQLRLFSQRIAAGDFNARLAESQGGVVEAVKPQFEALAGVLASRFLAAEETRLQLMAALNGMREGVVLCDPDGRVLLMNPSFRRMIGFEEPVRGRYLLREAVRDPELNEAVERALKYAQGSSVSLPLEQGKNESQALVTPIDGLPGGSGGGVVVLLFDRTEERKVERLRSDFVANVSHELRTPLSAIKAVLETLADGALDDGAVNRSFVDKALRHSERLEELLSDLLSLAQLEEQKRLGGGPVKAACVAAAAWEEAQALLEPSIRRHKAVMQCEGLGDLPGLAMDRTVLRQILVNYVENALKHSGPDPVITVGGRTDAGAVEVWVQDRGQGIPLEDQARIFERFYRVDKARTRANGGSGLGLSIVKHLAENAGASVGVVSQPGQGSRFWVRAASIETSN